MHSEHRTDSIDACPVALEPEQVHAIWWQVAECFTKSVFCFGLAGPVPRIVGLGRGEFLPSRCSLAALSPVQILRGSQRANVNPAPEWAAPCIAPDTWLRPYQQTHANQLQDLGRKITRQSASQEASANRAEVVGFEGE